MKTATSYRHCLRKLLCLSYPNSEFAPELPLIGRKKTVRYTNFYEKSAFVYPPKGFHNKQIQKKGIFRLKSGFLVALRRFFIIMLVEPWKVHCSVVNREEQIFDLVGNKS